MLQYGVELECRVLLEGSLLHLIEDRSNASSCLVLSACLRVTVFESFDLVLHLPTEVPHSGDFSGQLISLPVLIVDKVLSFDLDFEGKAGVENVRLHGDEWMPIWFKEPSQLPALF